MSRKLDDLDPRFRPAAMELIARCAEQGIPLFVVDTLRTPAEQAENLRRGVSWTPNSKHLFGCAIDVCPFEIFNAHGPDKLQWNADDPVWLRIGEIGEKLGLVWGGRWKHRDMGHFEMVTVAELSRA